MYKWIVLLVFLGGCHFHDPYIPPVSTQHALDTAYAQANFEGFITNKEAVDEPWWHIFQDPQLNHLIEQAIQNSPSMESAASKIRASEFCVLKGKSYLLPKVDFLADFDLEQQSRTSRFPTFPGFPFTWGETDTLVSLTYDFDIWKKNRDRIQQYYGKVYSDTFDYHWSELMLSLAVAQNYIHYQLTQEKLHTFQQIHNNRTIFLQLVEATCSHNLGDQLKRLEANVQVEAVETNIAQLQLALDSYKNALKCLVANFETPLTVKRIDTSHLFPFTLSRECTLDLIGQRPDIQSQVWKIYSGCKKMTLAKKEFYPDLNLSAFFGYSTIELQKLFSVASTEYKLSPAIHLPIFYGGELEANLGITQEEFIQNISEYHHMILEATKEFLDALASLRQYEKQRFLSIDQVVHEKARYNLTEARLQYNLDSQFLVLEQEQRLLEKSLEVVEMEKQSLLSILKVIHAVGG